MGGLFSKPKVSKPAVVTDTTSAVDAAKAAADAQRQAEDQEAARKRANLQSNMLGSTEDTTTSGPVIQKKRLLGE